MPVDAVSYTHLLAYREYRQNLENALTTIPMGENGAFQELPFLQTTTLYNSWIGGHPNSVAGLIFIYACPVYASLAYSWTYLSEEQNGYARILVAKVGKRHYYLDVYKRQDCQFQRGQSRPQTRSCASSLEIS